MADLVELIPGYRAAVDTEQLSRDASFLPITETVGGFELRPLTLRDYITLRMMRSPLICGGTPSPGQLAAFLWLLSPSHRPGLTLGAFLNRRLFLRRCKYFLPSSNRADRPERMANAARLLVAIRAYVEEAFQDRPPTKARGWIEDYYSDAAALCGMLAREYGWSEKAVLDMPMKRIFQYLNEIKAANGSKSPLCNPSDRIKSEFMAKINRKN